MKTHTKVFVVRWITSDGEKKRKEYDTEDKAREAKAWLLKNGAPDVDIAVRVVPVANHFPTSKGDNQ